MPRGGDELDAESSHVPSDSRENIRIGLTGSAAARAHLPQSERSAQKAPQILPQRLGEAQPLHPDDEVFAVSGGQPIVVAERDGPCRAGGRAIAAEQAFAQVNTQHAVRPS